MSRFLLTAILIAACTFPCAAQTKEVVEEVEAKLTDLRIAARHADERAEDVEILRRLLNKALGLDGMVSILLEPPTSWHGSSTTLLNPLVVTNSGVTRLAEPSSMATVWPQGPRVTQAVSPFDGVYLKGAGVVYTLRVPAGADFIFDPHTQRIGMTVGCAKCHQDASVKLISHTAEANSNCTSCHTVGEVRPGVKPLSEWEQAKMALRGEKPTAPEPKKADKPRGVICEPGTLVEQLTAQLYANAKNVRHLGEKESITLVVTFDSLPGAMQTATGAPTKLGLTPDEVQALTLGDLHLKQKKYTEAIEEYLKGLIRFRETIRLNAPANTPDKDVTAALEEMTASIRTTYKSLATAYLQLGHLEDAKHALEKATTVRVELGTPSTGDRPKTVGPAKLMVSVAKADLASTKDVAAFKKVVRVERVNFPAAMEKTTK